MEEGACPLPCNIQNNSSHRQRSLPWGVVWSKDSHDMPELRETAVNVDELRDRDWEKKIEAKTYADERRGAQPNDLPRGDQTSCQPNLKVSLTKSLRRKAIVL